VVIRALCQDWTRIGIDPERVGGRLFAKPIISAAAVFTENGNAFVAESELSPAVTSSARISILDTMSVLPNRTWYRCTFLMMPALRTTTNTINDVESFATIQIFYIKIR